MNLLKETIHEMLSHGYLVTDIKYVIVDGMAYQWEDFAAVADFEYDSGYGSYEVNPQMTIVMEDGHWFEREEYDGSEWWKYRTYPTPEKPTHKMLKQEMLRVG